MPFHLAAIPWENAVFIIIFLMVGFFQWIAQEAAKRKKGERPPPSKPAQAAPPPREETDADRIRRFLEALGQPTDAKPPPRAQPRPEPPPRTITPSRRPFASPLPPLTTVPPDLPPPLSQPAVAPAPPPPPAAPALPTVAGEVVRTATGVIAFPEPALRPTTGLQVIALLKSSSGLRDAVILREVLGPPRSFQPFDLM